MIENTEQTNRNTHTEAFKSYYVNNPKADVLNLGTHIEALYAFIGGNLSEERFSPVPPSKDF